MKTISESSLILAQPTQGYRYNLDSFLLASFAQWKKTDAICDLGCGVGVIALLALMRSEVARAVGVDIQAEMIRYAEENKSLNGCGSALEFLHQPWQELRKFFQTQTFDGIISNPPYHILKTGKLNPHSATALARHEIAGDMRSLIEIASYLLKAKGRLYLIYPILRFEELIENLKKKGLKPKRIRWIHPALEQPASHFIVEAVRSSTCELKIEAPLIVYKDLHCYTEEVDKILECSPAIHRLPSI